MFRTLDFTFPAAGGYPLRAALALPRTKRTRPGVIVIHEVLGLNDDIRELTSRIADLGYVAMAPDLYGRGGPRLRCVARAMLALRRGSGEAWEDLDAARAWLADQREVDRSRLGVVGFCMGGGFALLFAARAPFGAAAVFYGGVPNTAAELRGVCPVFGSYGGRDKLFASQGRRLERLLTELNVPHDVRIYEEAGHSFMSRHGGLMAGLAAFGPLKVGFHHPASQDSWRRLGEFFEEHLG